MSKQTIGLTIGALVIGLSSQTVKAEGTGLEEVVVTAQKREQTLAEVPLAVAVLGADALERQNVTSVGELQSLVPNLHVSTSPFNPVVNIRGVGSGGGSRTFEQSVATYVDGVYAGRRLCCRSPGHCAVPPALRAPAAAACMHAGMTH